MGYRRSWLWLSAFSFRAKLPALGARMRKIAVVLSVLFVACGGEDDDAPDAAAVDAPVADAPALDASGVDAPVPDAVFPDAAMIDAVPPPDVAPPSDAQADATPPPDAGPADAFVCSPSLSPTDVGGFDIVMSELEVGSYVELFNRTAIDVDLTTLATHRWCAFPAYPLVSASAVTVPAGGFATVPWPPSLTAPTDANGELVLHLQSPFEVAGNVLDYVCWGGSMTTRKAVAEAAGKWSGACVASIPAGGSLHRLAGTPGTSAADYVTDSVNTPMNCVP
jgi:hypothetical protein